MPDPKLLLATATAIEHHRNLAVEAARHVVQPISGAAQSALFHQIVVVGN